MARIFNEVVLLACFEKDLKRLSRRFRSLEEDLKNLIQTQLQLFHKLGIDNGGIFQIPGLGFNEPKVYKVKKFARKALKGRGVQSGIRVIYAYFTKEDRVEFVEIYFKGDKVNEDRHRIARICPRGGTRG